MLRVRSCLRWNEEIKLNCLSTDGNREKWKNCEDIRDLKLTLEDERFFIRMNKIGRVYNKIKCGRYQWQQWDAPKEISVRNYLSILIVIINYNYGWHLVLHCHQFNENPKKSF